VNNLQSYSKHYFGLLFGGHGVDLQGIFHIWKTKLRRIVTYQKVYNCCFTRSCLAPISRRIVQ